MNEMHKGAIVREVQKKVPDSRRQQAGMTVNMGRIN